MSEVTNKIPEGVKISGFSVIPKGDRESLEAAIEMIESAAPVDMDYDPDGTPVNKSNLEGYLRTEERLKIKFTKDGQKMSFYIHPGFLYEKSMYGGEEFYTKRLVELFARDRRDAGVEMAMILTSQRLQDGTAYEEVLKNFFTTPGSNHFVVYKPEGGKPIMDGVSSIYQVIGYGVKFLLQRHGLVDADGTIPYHKRQRFMKVGEQFLDVSLIKQAYQLLGITTEGGDTEVQGFDLEHSVGAAALTTDEIDDDIWEKQSIGTCPEVGCGEPVILMDNCPTCRAGHSKCG